MKNSLRKLTAWLCCVAMLISMVPAVTLPVFAAELPVSGTVATGEYVLAQDHVLTGGLTVAADSDVVIDLNGKTITASDELEKVPTYINVAAGGKLTIKDSAGNGKIQFKDVTNSSGNPGITVRGEFVLEGGTLTGWSRSSAGAVVYLYDSAKFTMTGGTITGNTATSGTVIRTTGGNQTMIMSGGSITGNAATTATSGNIIDFRGTADAPATLIINGTANVSGNTVAGAAYAAANYEINGKNAHFVFGGTATIGYAYNDGDTVAEGDAPYSSYAITGAPTVAGIRWSAGARTPSSISMLEEGASITSVNGVAVTKKDASVLATAYGDATVDKMNSGNVYTYVAPVLPTSGTVAWGKYVLTDNVVLTNGLSVAAGTEVVIDLAGNEISMPDKDGVYFTINEGAKLTIRDSVGGGKVQFKETTAGHPGITLKGDFVLEGGELNGWTRASAGGLIYVYADSSFTMTGGKITDCSATSYTVIRSATGAGGVDVTITGGEISGNNIVASGQIIGLNAATADNPNTLTIAGDAIVAGNTIANAAYTGAAHEIYCTETTVVVGDNAHVGQLYNTGANAINNADGLFYSSIAVTGSAVVEGIRYSSSNNTLVTAKQLTTGASVKLVNGQSLAASRLDETAYAVAFGDATTNATDKLYGTEYVYIGDVDFAITVEQAENGTVSVDKATAKIGDTVTVTATPAQGYVVASILVDGEAISGTTFEVTGAHTVTATFVEATVPTSGTVPAGTYTLKEGLVLTGALAIKGDVTIDLAGQTISMDESVDKMFFNVAAGGKLTIKDSVGGGKVQGKNTAGGSPMIGVTGTFVLESGELNGWTRVNDGTYGAGGMIYLYADSTFTMNGGTITGADCNGGTVINTHANNGYNITFNMNGGSITGNNAQSSNIININGNADALSYINITGGTIAGNTVAGAAYTAAANEIVATDAVVTVSGGTLGIMNVSSSSGLTDGAKVEGALYSSVSFTGAPVVAGFYVDTTNETAVSVTELTEGANIKTINGGAASTVDYSVYAEAYDNSATSGVAKDKGTVYTYGGNIEYTITVTEGVNGTVSVDKTTAKAGETVTVTATPATGYVLEGITVDGKAAQSTFTVTGNHTVAATFVEATLPTSGTVPAGSYTLKEALVLTNGLTIATDTEVVIDLAGNTISMPDKDAVYFNIAAGAKLTIKDSVGGGKVQFKQTTAGHPGISLKGDFVLEGGELNGWTRAGAGGLMMAYVDSSFTMTGGKITGCSSTSYTVIRSDSSAAGVDVTITGGEISGNEAGGNVIDLSKGTAANPNTLTIAGNAIVADNTKGGVAFTAANYQIQAMNTTATIGGTARVGHLYVDGTNATNSGEYYSSITVTGAPTVEGVSWSSSARTMLTINDLTEGASIKTCNGASTTRIDTTVYAEAYDNSATSGVAKDKGTVYTYGGNIEYTITVEQAANGTVAADKTSGKVGTAVTVTATPAEGYAVKSILVDGKAIGGNTFTITGNHTVTAEFVEAVLPTSGDVPAGTYTLSEALVLTNTLNVKGNVIIDLAGQTVTMPDKDGAYFYVVAGGKLTIRDTVGGGKIQFKNTAAGNPGINVAGEFVLEGGELTGWTRINDGTYGAGGMVFLGANAKFTMTGGKLTASNGSNASAIRAQNTGVAITITGGEISGNNAQSGPAINIGKSGGQGYLTIGGTAVIQNNTYGGAAAAFNQNVIQTVDTIVTINGTAKVLNNMQATLGSLTAKEGSQINISGAPVVKYVRADSSAKTALTIGGLSEGAEVTTSYNCGFTVTDNAVVTEKWTGTSGNANDAGYIYTYGVATYNLTVDNDSIADYGFIWADQETDLVAGTKVTMENIPNEGYMLDYYTVDGKAIEGNTFIVTGNHTVSAVFKEGTVTEAVTLSAEDFVDGETIAMVGNIEIADGGIELTTAGTYALDLAGYTLTGASAPYFTIGAGVTLTITDSKSTGTVMGLEDSEAPLIVVNGGKLVLDKGTITGHHNYSENTANFGTINLADVATTEVVVNGGTITENFAIRGGAFSFKDGGTKGATLTINGGTITENVVERGGATIYTNGGSNITINGGVLGQGTLETGAADTQDLWIRNSNVAVNGGEIGTMYYLAQSDAYHLTISGDAKIAEIVRASGEMMTIEGLIEGANIVWTQQIANAGTASEAITTVPTDLDNTVNAVETTLEDGMKQVTYTYKPSLTNASFVSGSTVELAAGDRLDEKITLAAGTYVLDLKGQTLTCSAGAPYFTVSTGATLTIKDSVGGGKIVGCEAEAAMIDVKAGAKLVLDGGELTGHTNTANVAKTNAGAVLLGVGAEFVMNGGAITNNSAYRGGGVSTGDVGSSNVVIDINGGVIENNHAVERGANLYTYDAASVTIDDATLGVATYGADNKVATGLYGAQIRGGVAAISNTKIAAIDIGKGSAVATATITGNTVIDDLDVSSNAPVTIGNLTTGAKVVANTALTVAENDTTVFTEDDKTYLCKADATVSLTLVDGETTVVTDGTSVGTGVVVEAGTYTLDLNGKTLKGVSAPYFTVKSGAKLTIIDSVGGGKIQGISAAAAMINVEAGGELVLAGGTLTGHTSSKDGGAVYNAGTFTMTGGEISGNTAAHGAGIQVANNSVTTISGGKILNNVATARGGAISTAESFATEDKRATITISGGEISGNTSATTPASNGILTYTANLAISGGEIADQCWIRCSTTEVTGGTISGTFNVRPDNGYNTVLNISGSAVIENMALAMTVTGGESTVAVGELAAGAKIVSNVQLPVEGTNVAESVQGSSYTYRLAGSSLRVLSIGNSYSGDSLQYLTAVADKMGKSVETAYLYVGSQTIRQHALSLAESLRETDLSGNADIGGVRDDNGKEAGQQMYSYRKGDFSKSGYTVTDHTYTIPMAIADGDWDVIILHGGVYSVGYPGTYNSDLDFLVDYLETAEPTADIYWNMTWAGDESREAVSLTKGYNGSSAVMYNAIVDRLGEAIVGENAAYADRFDGWFPVGAAIQNMRAVYDATPLTRDNTGHLSGEAGRMIAALTIAETLFGNLDGIDMEAVADIFANTKTDKDKMEADEFELNEENFAKMLAAVNDAYACVTSKTLPAKVAVEAEDGVVTAPVNVYDPNAAKLGTSTIMAAYENVTEFGNVTDDEDQGAAGAGRIVVWNSTTGSYAEPVLVIDQQWLDATFNLSGRYDEIVANGAAAEYYFMVDPINPDLANVSIDVTGDGIVEEVLMLAFTAVGYKDDQYGVEAARYMTWTTDGTTWSDPKAFSTEVGADAYEMTQLSDGSVLVSEIRADEGTYINKLTWDASNKIWTVSAQDTTTLAGVEVDVAFAEANGAVYGLCENGTMLRSADNGAAWTALSTTAGEYTSPALVAQNETTVYASWTVIGETVAVYGAQWTVTDDASTNYGWNEIEASQLAEGNVITSAVDATVAHGEPVAVVETDGTANVVYTTGKDIVTVLGAEAPVVEEPAEIVVLASEIKNTADLAASLAINFTVPYSTLVDMEGIYAVMDRAGKRAEIVEVPKEDWTITYKSGKADKYRIGYTNIAGKEMGDEITMTLYNAKGQPISESATMSLKGYAYKALASYVPLAKNNNAAAIRTCTTLVDMLNYGAMNQTKFDYMADALVNADLTADQLVYATTAENQPEPTENGHTLSTGIKVGHALELNEVIELKVSYTKSQCTSLTNATPAYAEVTYTDHNGNLKEFKGENAFEIVVDASNSSKYWVIVNTLTIADVSTQVTINLLDADKNLIANTECVTSIENYAFKVKAYPSLLEIAQTILNFGTSAYKQLHP